MSNSENTNLKLSDMFNGKKLYNIPEYQRGYAWEDSQLKDFFEDFSMKIESNSYYYGTILLQKKEKYNNFEIVDGQQRITTLIIFISCIIERMRELNYGEDEIEKLNKNYIKNENGESILELQRDDNEFFKGVLNGDSNEECFPSHSKLKRAREYFTKRLKNCDNKQIDSLIERIKLTEVLVYYIESKIQAVMIFETTNDRGKPLTNLEKTKSYLMYKASEVGDGSEQLLKCIDNNFTRIYTDYKSLEEKFKDENAILQYSFIAKEKWNTKEKETQKNINATQSKNYEEQIYKKPYQHYMAIMKNKVEELIKKENKQAVISYIEGYVKRIRQTFESLKKMVEKGDNAFKDILYMRNVAIFYPLLIKCWQYDDSLQKENFENICKLCEMFSFRVFVIAGKRSDSAQCKWYELARDFEGDFKTLANAIVKLLNDYSDLDNFKDKLKNPKFYLEYKSFQKNYFFWKYENWLRTQPGFVYSLNPHDDLKNKGKKGLTMEHIVAQKNDEEKFRIIGEGITLDIDSIKDEFDAKYLHRIANLTLDSRSGNSSKGKDDVESKMSKYQHAPLMCQTELIDFCEEQGGKKVWTKQSFEKREKRLLEFAEEVWGSVDSILNKFV